MKIEQRDLSGSVVLVTGAGAGIGAATAELLTDHGARVVVADRDADAATALVDRLPEGRAMPCAMDVTSAADARRAVAAAVERWGRLDSVVCNAGIGVFGGILDYPRSTSHASSRPTCWARSGPCVRPWSTSTRLVAATS